MSTKSKIYLVTFIFISILLPVYAFNTDLSIRHIAGNDSNVKTVGLTILGASIYEGIPGFLGPKFNQMQECRTKYDQFNSSSGAGDTIIIDTNDFCNTLSYLNNRNNPNLTFEFIPYDYNKTMKNLPNGLASLGSGLEITTNEVPNGLIMNNSYYASETFKNIPVLKNAFAQIQEVETVNQMLTSVKQVWEFTRNVAFSILLLAALVTGISIMSAKAMSGKDTDAQIITAEKALPRVVLAVILISSSYWIGELTVNTIIGSGITQGIAKFIALGFFENTEEASILLNIPTNVLYYQSLSESLEDFGWAALVSIIMLLFFVVFYIRLNIYILMNLVFALIFIIFAPLVLAQGALPSDLSGSAFRRYAYNLIYYISAGFLFSLLSYGTRAVLIIGLENNGGGGGLVAQELRNVAVNIAGGGAAFSFFFPIVAVFILWNARQVTQIASSFAARFSGAKEGGVGMLAPTMGGRGGGN